MFTNHLTISCTDLTITEASLGPKTVISDESEPVGLAESVTTETNPSNESGRKIAEAGAAMLQDVIDLRHILEPCSRKRALLVLNGVIDAQRVREIVPSTLAILARYERIAQIAPDILGSEKIDEKKLSGFAEFMARQQKYSFLTNPDVLNIDIGMISTTAT